MNVDPGQLIVGDKRLTGFQLGNWLQTKGLLFKLTFINRVKKQLSDALSSQISQTFFLEDVENAITQYTGNMSNGKVLLLSNQKD